MNQRSLLERSGPRGGEQIGLVAGAVLALLGAAAFVWWQWTHRGLWSYNTAYFPLDDADEWRYTACSRLVARGYGLFTEVFSAQPPLLFVSLAAGIGTVSDSITGARAVEVAFGCLSLVATGAAALRISGPVAAGTAVLVLAFSPLFLVYSRAVEAEGPMMSLVTAALAILLWRHHRTAVLLAALAGLCIAAAVLIKLFAVAALAPALWLLISAQSQRREKIVSSAVLLGGAMMPVALEMVFVSPRAQWDQVVRLHDRAAGLNLPDALSNADILWRFVVVDAGLVILSCAGIALLWWTGRWREAGFLVLWIGGFGAMLGAFHPLFPHHTAILLTALAVAAGCAAGEVWNALLHRLRGALVVGSVAVLGYLVFLPHLARADRHMLVAWDRVNSDRLAAYIQRTTRSSDFIVTDDLAAADLSHRLVPPNLCDPSTVRFLSGYLSDATAESQTLRYHPRAVAPTAVYLQLRGFLAWLGHRYMAVRGPNGIVVYRAPARE